MAESTLIAAGKKSEIDRFADASQWADARFGLDAITLGRRRARA